MSAVIISPGVAHQGNNGITVLPVLLLSPASFTSFGIRGVLDMHRLGARSIL